ncbi:MAG: hypothetical protein IJ217_02915 [Clostridia bacterium]|nr:hypothetical protein [Clostridia bacterium]
MKPTRDLNKPLTELDAKEYIEQDPVLVEFQKKQRNLIRERKWLPRDQDPNQATFEKIGFHFFEIPEPLFLRAEFPSKWHMEAKERDIFGSIIYDEKNRKRAEMSYVSTGSVTYARIRLLSRYITRIRLETGYDEEYVEVFDNANDEVLFTAGHGYRISMEQETDFFHKAFHWLDEHYPRHLDQLQYWD